MKAKHLPIVGAAALCAFTGLSARAQIAVEWITQFGSSQADIGNAITVDASGKIWVTGQASGTLGGASAGGEDIFLSRLSANGTVDFIRKRGGQSTDVGFGIALVGSGTVFHGGNSVSNTVDGKALIGGSDALMVRYDSSGNWQRTDRFGTTANEYIQGMAGNTTHLLAAGYTYGTLDGQANAGDSDAFLSKRDSTGALVWTRLLGTSAYDDARAAAFDSNGNGYLFGSTNGSFSGFTNAGSYDLFVARYDAGGNRTLLKQFGSTGFDNAYDAEIDASGNIYIAGATGGTLGGQSNAGSYDSFVTKLDSTGNVLWTRLLGSSTTDQAGGLAVDSAGHVWVGGYTTGNFGGHTVRGTDAFVAEYASNGQLLGTTFLTSVFGYFDTSAVVIKGLAIGPDDAAYVTGFAVGVLGGPGAGNEDVFVAKIVSVPEPASAVLLLGGAALLGLRRRR